MKTKNAIIILNIILTILVFIGNYFYNITDYLFVKTLTSAGFVVIGLVNLAYIILNREECSSFIIFMIFGLFFALLGDIVLELNFIIGAALFAVGHIFYFFAYVNLQKLSKLDLLVSVVLALSAGLFVLICPLLEFDPSIMMIVCLIYAIIISFMLGKSTGNFIKNRSVLNVVLFIGSLLFFISDLMLLFSLFMNVGAWAGDLCLATYYPAECLLAISMLVYALFNPKVVDKK